MPIEVQGLAPLLQVFDMPTSIRFYRDKLGFEVIGSDNKPEDQCDWVLLSLNGTQLMLNTAYEADERPPAPDPLAGEIAELVGSADCADDRDEEEQAVVTD